MSRIQGKLNATQRKLEQLQGKCSNEEEPEDSLCKEAKLLELLRTWAAQLWTSEDPSPINWTEEELWNHFTAALGEHRADPDLAGYSDRELVDMILKGGLDGLLNG